MDIALRRGLRVLNLKRVLGIGVTVVGIVVGGPARGASPITVIPDYDHGTQVELANQSRALRQLKAQSPDLDCLFMEVDSSVNPSLESFLGGLAPYYSSVQAWIGDLERFTGYGFKNVIPADFLGEVRSLKIRVYGIDLDLRSGAGLGVLHALQNYYRAPAGSFEATRAFVELGITQRNFAMAKNARAEFNARGCRRAALVVGSSHLADVVNNVPSVPLRKLLEQQGFAVTIY